jgi:poly-gamma-glutamate capsule biosynthesis protein CapA/YwtB (metallophosphatase superfamily)
LDFAIHHPVIIPAEKNKKKDENPFASMIQTHQGSASTKQRIPRVRCFIFSLLVILLVTASSFEPAANLVFLGDIMLGRWVAEAHTGGDWDSTLQSLHPITRSADLALANLESPFGCGISIPSKSRLLVAPNQAVAALFSAGIDILSTVNNHARDAGAQGINCTHEVLASQGIQTLDFPDQSLEISHRGLAVTFLAFDFTDGYPDAKIVALEKLIRRAKEAGRIVIVSLHWGMEYQAGSEPEQRRIAVRLSGAGADLIWGHHPHVVQEVVWIGQTLVLYSLGNTVFDQQQPESVRRGALAWVHIDRRGVRSAAIILFSINPHLGETGGLDLRSLQLVFPESASP